MKLARLPLLHRALSKDRSDRLDSNQRSPVPDTGGVARLPHGQLSTLGGTRTRSLRIESPASSAIRPRGQGVDLAMPHRGRAGPARASVHAYSGGRARTCVSRVTVARRTDSTTPERNGGSRTRTCGRRTAAYALATRCLARLGHASRTVAPAKPARPLWSTATSAALAEGEGIEPPRPQSPPVFETGYRACGSPSRWPRQASNLQPPG